MAEEAELEEDMSPFCATVIPSQFMLEGLALELSRVPQHSTRV